MRPAAPMRPRSTALRSTMRAYWAAWTAVGVSFATLERFRDGDYVDGLAALEEVEDRGIDPGVGLTIEVVRTKELGDLHDRVAVDEDRAEHRLLGLQALRRQTVDHGVTGLRGTDGVLIVRSRRPGRSTKT